MSKILNPTLSLARWPCWVFPAGARPYPDTFVDVLTTPFYGVTIILVDGIEIWWTLGEDGHPDKRLALPGEYHYPHDQYRLVFKEDCEVGRRSGSRATRGIHPQYLTPRLQRHLFEGAEHECPHGCLCKVQVPHPKGITP